MRGGDGARAANNPESLSSIADMSITLAAVITSINRWGKEKYIAFPCFSRYVVFVVAVSSTANSLEARNLG